MIYDLQKASVLKRISAWMFDAIILATLAAGIAFIFSAVFGYDAKLDRMEEIYTEYEAEFGIDLEISDENFAKLTDEEKAKYDEANKKFGKDEEVIYLTNMLFTISLLIVSLSILIAFVILELILPLILKNGQTLGKKIFGIAVMRDDGVRITPFVLFVRTVLGKYTIETMVPIFLIYLAFTGAGLAGALALLLLLGFQIGLLIKTKTNSAIHDILAYTVTVDYASQMIFDSKEALMEYKNRVHAEDAEKKPY
ncbi:MAG: RDD family protein [Clostridia bacterium]|nr:RDD family protein [Clostridia bacterium]